MEKSIEDLANWTNEEVKSVVVEDADQWRANPGKAIRHFYPRLHELAIKNDAYGCACFTPAEYSSMGLKPLHFNFYSSVNLFDVHPGCTDNYIFEKRYGLSPSELAIEVSAKRALVFLNADPKTITADEALTLGPLTNPALGQGRLQLTHIRHAAFKRWLRPGLGTSAEGDEIYGEFFDGCLNQDTAIQEAVFGNPGLRLGMQPTQSGAKDQLKGAIKGRWDHIRHFDSEAADQLKLILRETDDYLERSILFNTVKELVCAEITMAKGGLYRMSYPQIKQQQDATELARRIFAARLPTTMSENDGDLELISIGALKLILPDMPVPEQFTWEDYNSLRSDGYFEPIQDGIAEALRIAAQQIEVKDRDEIERKMLDDYATHTRAFKKFAWFRRLIESPLGRVASGFLEQPFGTILKVSPIAANFLEGKRQKSPGHHLAHGVFQADRKRELIVSARGKPSRRRAAKRKSPR